MKHLYSSRRTQVNHPPRRMNNHQRSRNDYKLPRKYLPHKHAYTKLKSIQDQISKILESSFRGDFIYSCPICGLKCNSFNVHSHFNTHPSYYLP